VNSSHSPELSESSSNAHVKIDDVKHPKRITSPKESRKKQQEITVLFTDNCPSEGCSGRWEYAFQILPKFLDLQRPTAFEGVES
jgi:hypothetical protein